MKITKHRLKQIIKEEIVKIMQEEPSMVHEEEAVDLAKLQPAAEAAAAQVISAVEKEAGGEESLENLLVQAIITQLQASVG